MIEHSNTDVLIASLEGRLRLQPDSPSFARLASYYLGTGKAGEALQLCVEGLKNHPNYPTAHLVLGRCFEALGRSGEAINAYRAALASFPDNPTVQGLCNTVKERAGEQLGASSTPRHVRSERTKDAGVAAEYITAPLPPDLEILAARLQDAARIIPKEQHPACSESEHADTTDPKFATATLANIYASQGKYRLALRTYKKLAGEHPDEEEIFAKRIAELEMLQELSDRETEINSNSLS